MEMQIRRRMKALDGTTFRFERKNGQLFLNDGLLHVRLLKGGVVELVTEYKCVQVSGADYWEMVYDERVPTKLSAGTLLARLNEMMCLLHSLVAQKQELQATEQFFNSSTEAPDEIEANSPVKTSAH